MIKNHLVVFSKDRACQLHLLLESIETNARGLFSKTTVLYKPTKQFISNYQKLKSFFPNCFFVEEKNFKNDLISLVDDSDFDVVTFCVDDAIFYNKITEDKQQILKDVIEQNAIFSLRLGKNSRYSHPANIRYCLLEHEFKNGVITFDHTLQQAGDFSYPLSTDGHIYNTSLLKALLLSTPFNSPNTLEANMQYFVQTKQIPKTVMCFETSKLVSVPVNLVNESITNRHGTIYNLSANELNDNYTKDLIVDFQQLDFTNIDGPHKELLFTFKPNPYFKK